ncbi:GNAT family N-acetyltransferase [Microbacterium resistens]
MHARSGGGCLRTFWRRIPLRRPRLLRGAPVPTPLHARPIETARLRLRPYEMRDAADWYRIQSTPEILEFLPWPKRSRRASRRHLRHRTRHVELRFDGDFLAFAVTREGRLIGDVSMQLRGTTGAPYGVEVGWLLLPEFSGEGYAAEAAEAMLDAVFSELGAHWALAEIHPENERSMRLASRLGFAFVAAGPDGQHRLLRRPPS